MIDDWGESAHDGNGNGHDGRGIELDNPKMITDDFDGTDQ